MVQFPIIFVFCKILLQNKFTDKFVVMFAIGVSLNEVPQALQFTSSLNDVKETIRQGMTKNGRE